MHRPNLYAKPEAGTEGGKGKASGTGAPSKLVSQYWREIERYRRATSSWHEEGEQIERLYLDEDRTQNSARRFALLWANVETLKPAVYAKPPVVMCSRRYKDRDPIARIAAELMERATNTTFDLYNVDETFQMVRDDRLLPGRGQGWVRYEADIEQYEADAADDDEPAIHEKVTAERVCTDYVHWTDFGHNVAGAWNDVWLVWRAVYKTEDEVAARFGADKAAKLTYDAKAPISMSEKSAGSMGEAAEDFCKIYEVWDKRRKLTSWITEGLRGQFIESGPPPVNFSNFFPCPKPCYATKTSKSLIPRPDYIYYRDQAKEINDLTAKIANMTDWLVVKGFVPGAPSRVSDAIEEVIRDKGNREVFTQVESWTEWTEKGGIAKLIDWMPIDMIIKTLQAAIQARTQLIQDVFQITGLSDILRGATDPNETLGAQELKAQTGSRRLRNTKDEVARFCKDIARLNAEVIAEKFEAETIAAITGYRYQPPAPKPITLPGLGMPLASNIIPMPGVSQPQPSIGSGQVQNRFGVEPIPGPMPGAPPVAGGMQSQGMVGGNGDMNPAPADAMGGLNPPGAAAAPPGTPPTLAPPPKAMTPPGIGAPAMPQQPMGMDASQSQGQDMVFDDRVMKLLRDDRLRSFRIDVETDSTGQADEQAEKQAATEFLTATGAYMEKAVAAMTAQPEVGGLAGEMLMYVVRRYRAGRTLEEEIERTFGQLQQKALAVAQQGPKPDPEQIKAEAADKAMQAEMAMKEKDFQLRMAESQQNAQMEAQKHSQELAYKAQEQQIKQQGMEADLAFKAKELELKERELALKAEEFDFNRQSQMESAMFERQSRMEEHAFKREESQANRAAQDEDRQFQREIAIEDLRGKHQDRELKTHETQARLDMEKGEQQARRVLEGEQMKGEGGKSAKAEIQDSVSHQIQELASQFAGSMQELSSNQVQIVSVLQDIKGNQDEVTDAVTKIAGHMTAPRKVARDPESGKVVGVEIGQSEGDLRKMLEKLNSGRKISRDKTGRAESFE